MIDKLRKLTDDAMSEGMEDYGIAMHNAANRIEELEAANDAAEKSNRISDNRNLWRFWAEKARELADKNVALRKALKETDRG